MNEKKTVRTATSGNAAFVLAMLTVFFQTEHGNSGSTKGFLLYGWRESLDAERLSPLSTEIIPEVRSRTLGISLGFSKVTQRDGVKGVSSTPLVPSTPHHPHPHPYPAPLRPGADKACLSLGSPKQSPQDKDLERGYLSGR